jgi:hypothetical protein
MPLRFAAVLRKDRIQTKNTKFPETTERRYSVPADYKVTFKYDQNGSKTLLFFSPQNHVP